MKKILKLTLVSLLIFSFLIPYTAFADTTDTAPDWQDIELTDEEFNALLENNPDNSIMPYSSGLISSYRIAVSKSGSNLVITGQTRGTTDVVKCGFTKVTIQYKTTIGSSWTDYKTYTDIYADTFVCNLSKTIAIPGTKIQFRVVCTHYAKKSLLSTEKIQNTSNTVAF